MLLDPYTCSGVIILRLFLSVLYTDPFLEQYLYNDEAEKEKESQIRK